MVPSQPMARGPKLALLSHRIVRRWPGECITAGPRARVPRPQPRWPSGHLHHGPCPPQDREARHGNTAFLRTDPPPPLSPASARHRCPPHSLLRAPRPFARCRPWVGDVLSPRRPGTWLSDFLGVDFRVSRSSFPGSPGTAHTGPPVMCSLFLHPCPHPSPIHQPTPSAPQASGT